MTVLGMIAMLEVGPTAGAVVTSVTGWTTRSGVRSVGETTTVHRAVELPATILVVARHAMVPLAPADTAMVLPVLVVTAMVPLAVVGTAMLAYAMLGPHAMVTAASRTVPSAVNGRLLVTVAPGTVGRVTADLARAGTPAAPESSNGVTMDVATTCVETAAPGAVGRVAADRARPVLGAGPMIVRVATSVRVPHGTTGLAGGATAPTAGAPMVSVPMVSAPTLSAVTADVMAASRARATVDVGTVTLPGTRTVPPGRNAAATVRSAPSATDRTAVPTTVRSVPSATVRSAGRATTAVAATTAAGIANASVTARGPRVRASGRHRVTSGSIATRSAHDRSARGTTTPTCRRASIPAISTRSRGAN
ncbi:hypothetical protein ASF23_03745 [Curtobacterium sp. Leaf261]|nr:hypothetical protein ASF23_03745 [Curtobacterium sp. Leaf261]